MKIISYNVNGIRAAMNKGLLEWLQQVDADVVCLQETKAHKEQVDLDAISQIGYTHQYWFSAEKKGYSGVAIWSKQAADSVEEGIGIPHIDSEGRNIRADFGSVSVMSMYLPSGTNIDRLDYKFAYMDDILVYLNGLQKKHLELLVCGDYNICHKAIDIHDPVRNKKVSGFLPEERAWLDDFIASGFVDTFRMFNTEADQYTWWSYRANSRAKNKGWRLDYGMVTAALSSKVNRSVILNQAVHSDHCPILIELKK